MLRIKKNKLYLSVGRYSEVCDTVIQWHLPLEIRCKSRNDAFNVNTKSTSEWWKKMGEFWNPCLWPLIVYPKVLMSLRKAVFSSSFLIFSLNPKILSGQSILEVFQREHSMVCLPVNHCKVCRFLLFSVTTNSHKETPIIVIIWEKRSP